MLRMNKILLNEVNLQMQSKDTSVPKIKITLTYLRKKQLLIDSAHACLIEFEPLCLGCRPKIN